MHTSEKVREARTKDVFYPLLTSSLCSTQSCKSGRAFRFGPDFRPGSSGDSRMKKLAGTLRGQGKK